MLFRALTLRITPLGELACRLSTRQHRRTRSRRVPPAAVGLAAGRESALKTTADCRTSKLGGISRGSLPCEASWTAAVLCRLISNWLGVTGRSSHTLHNAEACRRMQEWAVFRAIFVLLDNPSR